MDADDVSPQKSARLTDDGSAMSPDYRPAWRDYRRREWWFFGEWLGGFLAILAASELATWLGLPAVAQLAIPVLAPVWTVGFIVLGCRVRFFPCPRCHRPFFFRFFYWPLFDRTCRHCGLPLWAATDVRTPGSLFAWYPPDNERAAGSNEPLGDSDPHSASRAIPLWRLIVGEVFRILALFLAIVAIVEAALSTRWLFIDWRQGAQATPLFWGIALTLGQALLVGAIVELVFVVLLWLAAGWIQRVDPPSQN